MFSLVERKVKRQLYTLCVLERREERVNICVFTYYYSRAVFLPCPGYIIMKNSVVLFQPKRDGVTCIELM